jgi:hypothetical protein
MCTLSREPRADRELYDCRQRLLCGRDSYRQYAPTVDAGPVYTIPQSTPFTLSAIGSDANSGDQITFAWEELILAHLRRQAPTTAPGHSSDSFGPLSNPSRTFPSHQHDPRRNTSGTGEALPTTRDDELSG